MTISALYRKRGERKPPQDHTFAVTVGRWGGFYCGGGRTCWRLCLGFVALTYFRAEFIDVIEAWLDSEELGA